MIYTNEMIKERNEKKKKASNVITIISIPFLILILLVCIYIYYQKFICKKDNVTIFGYKPLVVLTGSMKPNLDVGDLIFIKRVSNENELSVGDIITFVEEGTSQTVTHRIVNVVTTDGKKTFETKGDNNGSSDMTLVPFDRVVGKVFFKINAIGAWIMKIYTTAGIVISMVVIGLFWSNSNKKRDRAMAREVARKRFNFPKYKSKGEAV